MILNEVLTEELLQQSFIKGIGSKYYTVAIQDSVIHK